MKKTQAHRRQRQTNEHLTQGFTLIEIMAVVLIMGLLMGIIGVSISGQIDKARLATAKAQISQLESALEFY